MSVTGLLERDAGFRNTLLDLFPRPILPVAPPLICPPISAEPGLVGTAFDYILRWELERRFDFALVRPWVAQHAIRKLPSALQSVALTRVSTAKTAYDRFLGDGRLDSAVINAAVSLARLDAVYRSGRGSAKLESSADVADVEDLGNLFACIPWSIFQPTTSCCLNPTFGAASRAIGGADADLILDDLLVDLKTTRHFRLGPYDYHQLICYLLLSRIGETGRPNQAPIMQVGIYFARFATLVIWPTSMMGDEKVAAATTWMRHQLEVLKARHGSRG